MQSLESPVIEKTELESREAKEGQVHSQRPKKRELHRERIPDRPPLSTQLNTNHVPEGNELRLVRGSSHQGHMKSTSHNRKPHSSWGIN